jgi:hypothetical protein
MKNLPMSLIELNHFYEQFRRSGLARRGYRFGQAWINEYLPANQADPEIFYEEGDEKAYALIMKRYVRW